PTASAALRCVSKHEGHAVAVLILRDARTRVRVYATSSACALLRMRPGIEFEKAHDFKQPISFPRRVFCARVLHLCFTNPRMRVGGAPRVVRVLGGTPVRRAHNAARQAPSEAPCVP